ncbi:CLUMA_CG012439, isoform A [Clunio marinus]|uniref:CLUMA_CG012439, isoform A n=1 Tax=Clunio marinus TaxID=568069 RepID=A0A1J1IFT0_9DIPT|nr:CLUMA_CG012439, isoform A [Clunio marinus]
MKIFLKFKLVRHIPPTKTSSNLETNPNQRPKGTAKEKVPVNGQFLRTAVNPHNQQMSNIIYRFKK